MNMNLIQTLGVEVGVRPAGSEQAHTAAQRIADAFQECGLSSRLQEFEFTGYDPEEPTLEINGERWAAGPCVYAPATSAEGLTGTVRVLGFVESGSSTKSPVFAIDDAERREVARIYVNSRGGAVPSAPRLAPRLGGPSVCIGRADGEKLAGLENPQARLSTGGRAVPGRRDANVIARVEGESTEAIVVCAHFDSVWRGPGVIDNASGVEGMFQVLKRLSDGAPHARSLIFCAFAAEELGLLGSSYYVHEAKLRGELGDIAGVVNLDCIAAGTTLEVMAGPEELQGRCRAIVQQLKLGERYPVNVTPPQPGSDHVPFADEGIPSVAITYYPYPEYHSPDERPQIVDEVRLADAVDIAVALVESQLDAPAARVPHM
jgi:Iap family predicted aminopeptidase